MEVEAASVSRCSALSLPSSAVGRAAPAVVDLRCRSRRPSAVRHRCSRHGGVHRRCLVERCCCRWCRRRILPPLLGTGLSILISKRNPSLVASFALLSCGYVFSSYQEVKSVVLHTLNRARFSVAVESFLKTGHVPSLVEGNSKENIFTFPWSKNAPVGLGSRFGDAFQDPASFIRIEPLFEKERYIVTYNHSKRKVYALLKDQAKPDDILKAAFHAHLLLHFVRTTTANRLQMKSINDGNTNINDSPLNHHMPNADLEAQISESCKIVSASYEIFKGKTLEQGWVMSESLLNPGRARLLCRSKGE